VAGVGAALALGRFVESLLFDIQPRDAWTYLIVCVLLTLAAFVAALLPARRAARVDPLVALRAE
jgi:ABC-type lipoprotein release transport system permease subunit